MCGIIGYIGEKQALPILIEGLERLEYRGYDSSGVAVVSNGLHIRRAPGKIAELRKKLNGEKIIGNLGVAHTRWATHGVPNEANAHPHTDCSGNLALVHNGIIENFGPLKEKLMQKGHIFKSQTDTEVLAHLIEEGRRSNGWRLDEAVGVALKQVVGTYGVVVVSADSPGEMVVARLGSPIVLGINGRGYLVASDPAPILKHTRQMIFLDDGEMVHLGRHGYSITSLDRQKISKSVQQIDWTDEAAQRAGYAHFMLKEIMEQPQVVVNSTRGRLDGKEGLAVLGGLAAVADQLKLIRRLIIVACGSAYYAGLFGEYLIEELAGLPVEVELASEFRYRNPVLDKSTAVLAVSQSGETADTLAAVREAKRRGALTLGIVNVVGSTIARETDAGVYNHAGPEVGVASTKAFLSQCIIFILLAIFLGRQRKMSFQTAQALIESVSQLPQQLEGLLSRASGVEALAARYSKFNNFFFLGRHYNLPIAYEAALKLKEIAYAQAQGYASGEMKHGPIALVDDSLVSVFLAPRDSLYDKTLSNIQEIKARGGKVIAVATEGDEQIGKLADDVIFIPPVSEFINPLLALVPLQLFAYFASVARGCDPDRPRNLAKSVTVE